MPSTGLGLQLARALCCGVEDLFRLAPPDSISVRLVPRLFPQSDGELRQGNRVALGRSGGQWVAHALSAGDMTSADGILLSASTPVDGIVRPLAAHRDLERNVLVAGCAPLLGTVADWTNRRFADSRVRWIRAGNRRALQLLAEGMVHVAGLHFAGGGLPDTHDRDADEGAATANLMAVREALPGRRVLVANLTQWRQGIVLPPGNPLGVGGDDLLRPGLRLVQREHGSGADDLVRALLARANVCGPAPDGPSAFGHEDVARLVRWRSADAGIAIEPAALAEGLEFLPLADERFDLVVPAELAIAPPVSRLLDVLGDPGFHAEAARIPGYDSSLAGETATVEAA